MRNILVAISNPESISIAYQIFVGYILHLYIFPIVVQSFCMFFLYTVQTNSVVAVLLYCVLHNVKQLDG